MTSNDMQEFVRAGPSSCYCATSHAVHATRGSRYRHFPIHAAPVASRFLQIHAAVLGDSHNSIWRIRATGWCDSHGSNSRRRACSGTLMHASLFAKCNRPETSRNSELMVSSLHLCFRPCACLEAKERHHPGMQTSTETAKQKSKSGVTLDD